MLEHAFFPGLPFAARVLSLVIPFTLDNPTITLAMTGLLFVQVSFVFGAVGLYKLSEHVLGSGVAASRVSLFYIFASSNIFLSGMYTEAPFSMLTFWGLYWLYARRKLSVAVPLFSLAGLFRSNGVLAAGFVIHETFRQRRRLFEGLLGAGAIYLPYYVFSRWSYNLYCDSSIGGVRHEWCDSYSSLYPYIQKEFWKVAPFAYWRTNNIQYFLLMMPALIVSVYGIFWRLKERSSLILGVLHGKGSLIPRLTRVIDMWEIGYVAQMGILTVFTVFVANVQILTRILSSCPLFFWSIERMHSRASRPVRSLILAIHLGYFLIGPFIFGNGLNWT